MGDYKRVLDGEGDEVEGRGGSKEVMGRRMKKGERERRIKEEKVIKLNETG